MKRFFLPLLLSLFVASLVTARCDPKTVSPAEIAAFILVADVHAAGYSNHKLPSGVWRKSMGTGDSFKLVYEAKTPNSEKRFPLYLGETLLQEPNAQQARKAEETMRNMMTAGFKSHNWVEKPIHKQMVYGETSRLMTLQRGETIVGNTFVARRKSRTFTIMMVGLSFKDAKQWDAFAGKKIRAWLNAAK